MKSSENKNRVCPVERAGSLDNKFRRLLQNPFKILKPYIIEGSTAMDVGCGPGFFTIEIAELIGEKGHVVAVDLQEGMLQKLRNKIKGTILEERILLHKCSENRIGYNGKVDFILTFYMVHEVPDKEAFFSELRSYLNPEGKILIVETNFHVSKKDFENTLLKAKKFGLEPIKRPSLFFSRSAILTINNN
jgi:ubiquinone/menaquinone biosynthesis C-methylase UbiE